MKKLIKRDVTKNKNMMIIREETERQIDEEDISNILSKLMQKEIRLNKMLNKIQEQIEEIYKEREFLNNILEKDDKNV